MKEWERTYREAVNEARKLALNSNGVPRAGIDQLYLSYAQMLRDVDRDFGNGFITESRKESLRNSIIKRMDILAIQLQRTFGIQRINAIDRAIQGHQLGLDGINNLGLSVSANFSNVQDATLDFMLQRRGIFGSKNYQSIIGRGLQNMGGQVDRFLNSAISRGLSAERASQEFAGMIARNDPKLLGLINNGRLRKSEINKALKESTINLDTFKQARTVLFDAKRIMVTEINTAYREADILASYESPVVGYKKWQVSGRHFGLPSTPDVCTFYFESDQFNQGRGVFPILNTPSTPHPFCGCFQSDVFRDVNEWEEAKPSIQEPRILNASSLREDMIRASKNNQRLREGLSRVTDNHFKRQVEVANEYNQLAYKWASRVRRAVG